MSSILIIGTYRQTLTVIRSLARAGQNVVLGFHGDAATCNHSRYVNEAWQHPDLVANQNAFASALSKFLDHRPDIECVIPVGEDDMRFFIQYFATFSTRVKLLMCRPDIVNACLHKPTMSAIVDSLGIPQSRYAIAADSAALIAAADSIGYPCIVKLVDSEFLLDGRKAIVCEDPDTIRQSLAVWPIENKSMIVQAYIEGERHNLYFFAHDGQIVAVGQTLALRTDRVDGTGLSVCGTTEQPNPVLIDYCQTILEHLDYSGVGCMQFIVDDNNQRISFLEHNPRLGAGFPMIYHTGLDLPKLMLESADEDISLDGKPTFPCRVGARYAWITGDLVGLKRAFLNREIDAKEAGTWLIQILRSALTSSVHITWDWRDPLPTIMQLGKFGLSASKLLAQKKTD